MAASRRSGARAARALTGLRRSGSACSERAWLGAADGVRDSMIVHRLTPNRRLRAKRTPRCNKLILLPSSTHRPGRTSRLLSCNRSVGGLVLADPARTFAKFRSDKARPSITRASAAPVCCSRYDESLVTARASRVAKLIEARTQQLTLLCRSFARTRQYRRE